MKLGSEVFEAKKLSKQLKAKRVALLAHPASVDRDLRHFSYTLKKLLGPSFVCAFGPQHGIRGEKQDNMIESEDINDRTLNIPVYSLYGKSRRPTNESLKSFDVLIVDLQDIGTRVYTFITTLLYMLEAAHNTDKEVWVLDRPNPAGREVEGLLLEEKFLSFVGCSTGLILRHGLTMGELAEYFVKKHSLNVKLKVVRMESYSLNNKPNFGWPLLELPWVNPSPNIPRLSSVRCFPGTVLIEGTTLSEGRGTTRPLEVIGASDIDAESIHREMLRLSKKWSGGCYIRDCYFEPTFHKHAHRLCSGIQIHVDYKTFDPKKFKPFRLTVLFLKALRNLYPDYNLWKNPPYEYENEKMPIDLICGSSLVREWVDDNNASVGDLEKILSSHESKWKKIQKAHMLYKS